MDMTVSDVVKITQHSGNRGLAATGLGLAAGALALGVAGWLGLNAASKARSKGNQKAIDMMSQILLQERNSRESWQNQHAPTLTQYVDVRAGAGAGAGANALSYAEALALANNSGLGAAISRDCYLKVARVSGSQNCGCGD